MSSSQSPIGGEQLKRAVAYFAELVEAYPEQPRLVLLEKVQLEFDLSPAECEFLNKALGHED